MAALIALYGLLADPAQIGQTLEAVRPLVPPDVFAMVEGQIDQLAAAGQTNLGLASLISLALTLWSARAGVTALTEGLNVVYRETDSRGIVVQYLRSLALTAAALVVMVIALLTVVALPAFLHFSDLGPFGRFLAQVSPLAVLGLAIGLRHRRVLPLRPAPCPGAQALAQPGRARRDRRQRRRLAGACRSTWRGSRTSTTPTARSARSSA